MVPMRERAVADVQFVDAHFGLHDLSQGRLRDVPYRIGKREHSTQCEIAFVHHAPTRCPM
jgi:hypothetical protein